MTTQNQSIPPDLFSQSFHNTIGLEGKELEEANFKAGSQNERIYNFFKNNPDKLYIPSEVLEYIGMHKEPLTSFRRGISTLCSKGYLIKTSTMKKGCLGKMVHCITFNKSYGND